MIDTIRYLFGKTKHLFEQKQFRFFSFAFVALLFPILIGSPSDPQQTLSQSPTETLVPHASSQIAWLEPRGLSIANLVGLVPEEHLRDAIIAYRSGYGLVQYVSGTRNGDVVTINTKMTPRYWLNGSEVVTRVGCLGQMGVFDEWMGTAPASTMRLFANGVDITRNAIYGEYTYAGQIQPQWLDEFQYFRYNQFKGNPSFTDDNALIIPANMGCTYIFSGQQTNLTAQFTLIDPSPIQVTVLGSESFGFRSYIGPGTADQMGPLNEQMQRRFGNRHDKFTLNPLTGADYFLVRYPPTPVEPYPDVLKEINVALPGGGTYRIGRSDNTLSVDHTASMAMPLYGQWQDRDQSDGEFLRFFSDGTRLASPEYFVPAGVAYDPCMRTGGCSDALLDQIYNTEMQLTIYYYQISRTATGLTRIPLRQIGTGWNPAQAQRSNPYQQLDELIFLPIVARQLAPTPIPTPQLPADDPTGCPCGWFDSIGRMFDYIPPQ